MIGWIVCVVLVGCGGYVVVAGVVRGLREGLGLEREGAKVANGLEREGAKVAKDAKREGRENWPLGDRTGGKRHDV
jgi:hypothetical protein